MKRPIPKKKNPLDVQTDLMKVDNLIIPQYHYIKQVLPLVKMGGKHV
jgi:hypothetical protein